MRQVAGADDHRSIFAATYSIACFYRIWTSGHGFIRKIFLNILTIYSKLAYRYSRDLADEWQT